MNHYNHGVVECVASDVASMNTEQLYTDIMHIMKTIETPIQRWESVELGASKI